ncbi:CRISPR-associated endonuclease Cas6 [Lacihabitans lacunae]|uniref:CRISPR-associated endonuclease Cas6 n=1 Tax=Lacihabitans lacunae TaxID=1028214 RepID=A0ABV7YS17_9BACT
MKKLRYLTIEFDSEIAPYEVAAFRGAIAQKAGFEHVLFHNHQKDGTVIYKYPSIQYKRIGRNAAIVCIEDGVDEIHHFFQSRTWNIFIGDKELPLKVKSLNMNQITMQVWEKTFDYEINNWLPLNQDNFKIYLEIKDLKEKIEFLEKKLIGNIISMAKGIGWDVDKEIKMSISKLDEPRIIKHKSQKLLSFRAVFRTNVFIPNHLGIGKSASTGFGVVKSVNSN